MAPSILMTATLPNGNSEALDELDVIATTKTKKPTKKAIIIIMMIIENNIGCRVMNITDHKQEFH